MSTIATAKMFRRGNLLYRGASNEENNRRCEAEDLRRGNLVGECEHLV